MDENEIQRLLAESRQKTGQRVAEASDVYKKYDPATDPMVGALRGQQSEKLKELFSHDQQLSDVYMPAPQLSEQDKAAIPASTAEYVSQPRLIDPTIGLRAASEQTISTAGEAIDILQRIEQRKDILAQERDKSLSMLQLLIQAGRDEQSALEKQLDRILRKQEAEEDKRRWEEEFGLKKGEADKKARQTASYGDYRSYFSAEAGNRQEAEASAREMVKRNPQDSDIIWDIVDEMYPKEKAGAGVDEVKKSEIKQHVIDQVGAQMKAKSSERLTKEEFTNEVIQVYGNILSPQEIRNLINQFWVEEKGTAPQEKSWGEFWNELFGGIKSPIPKSSSESDYQKALRLRA